MNRRSIYFGLATTLALACAGDGSNGRISDKDCNQPIPPEVPDGRTATDVTMISATQRMKLYVESANEFLECLNRAEASIGSTAVDLKKKRIGEKRESATADLEKTTQSFNAQVRIYKTRDGETPSSN